MTSNFKLFNFLEEYQEQIASMVNSRLGDDHPVYAEISPTAQKELVAELVDGYIDLLVTGQTESVDRLYRALSRILAVRGSRLSDVFKLPLYLDSAIRTLLLEKLKDVDSVEEAITQAGESLNLVESTTHTLACRFLDVFQELMDERIKSHNACLERIQAESGVVVAAFRLVPDTE
jgi:hypothetical protein